MRLTIDEKKVVYDFSCMNRSYIVTRLKWLTSLIVDPQAKYRMLELARKMENEITESQYPDFYLRLQEEMDDYYRARRRLRQVEENVEIKGKMHDQTV